MHTTKRFIAMLLCALLSAPATLAQNPQRNSQTDNAVSQDVLIIIQQQQVRFTAQSAVEWMQLQVFNQSGEPVFDSSPVAAGEIIWPFQNANGEAIKSGLYAYTLSIKEVGKESGAETARVRRGHFIVDRAKDRDGSTDKLWVTSQNDNGVGTELTVARDENTTVAGAIAPRREEAKERGEAKRDGDGETKKEEKAARAELAVAGAGTPGQLAKFVSEEELGNSEITEVNGNVGIGTTTPSYKLDVAGALRAVRDTSNDIVVQTTGGTNAWARIGMITPSQRWSLGTSQNYNGNQFYLYDDTYRQLRMTIQPNAGEISFPSPSSNHVVVQTSGGTNAWAQFKMRTTNQTWTMGTSQNYNGNQFYLYDDTYRQPRMTIQPNAGEISFPSPSSNHVVVQTSGGTNAWAQLRMRTTNQTWAMGTSQNYNGDQFYLFDATRNQARLMIQPNGGAITLPLGNVGIGTTNPQAKLHVVGTTMTSVLQITGGADFAENFDVNVAETTGEAITTKVEAGMVVSIDPAHPGRLQLCTQAYDRRVAGIISGAGGVKPGMVMSQEGTLADGKQPVALSGRVYCWVDASQGAIEPGDLLTTSSTSGHAMKVADPAKAQGAIIGKAMTGLKEGKGLVLVLVTLQ